VGASSPPPPPGARAAPGADPAGTTLEDPFPLKRYLAEP
jgi:hypothetical protein